MYYNIRELYKTFDENKRKLLRKTFFIDGKMVDNMQEVFDKEIIPESHPYYEFMDVYNHTVVTFSDGSYTKYRNDYVEVIINKSILKHKSSQKSCKNKCGISHNKSRVQSTHCCLTKKNKVYNS